MNGRVLAVLAVGAVAVAGLLALGLVLLREPPPAARVPPAPVASTAPGARTPDDVARAACVQLRLATQGIQAGGAARDVRQQLASARALAAQALREDGRYAALSGGVAALDEAVRRDDGQAAAVALRVVQEECD